MYNITIISSFHKIHGECNPYKLYNIIEGLKPELIFEELSHDVFDIVYSAEHKPQTVEAITIKAYLQKYPIKHIPVDNYPVQESDLLSDAQIIWDNSSEYRELWNHKLLKLKEFGYNFLNSNECSEILNKIRRIEESFLTETNNLKLLNEHKKEKALHDTRENEMLKEIYDYSKENPYNNAIFICGAEHRLPLKNKIIEYEIKNSLKINWQFYNEA
jgi:hypothetical protein